MFNQKEDTYEYEETRFSLDEYLTRIQSKGIQEKKGILMLPRENWSQTGDSVFMPETFDFVKWVIRNKAVDSSITVAEIDKTKVAHLRSHDFWLPLVYLFSDVSLQIYLNLVANYIYDKIKGSLHSEEHIIELEVYSEDKKKGKVKKFSYHGSYHGLQEAIKKIDVKEFLD